MPVVLLSKSRFISGLQCPLRLWYQCYEPKLAAEMSPGQQAIFDAGHEVGRLATKLFPKGILIEEDHMHHREAEINTDILLKSNMVRAIFEGAFTFDGIRIRVDVLERIGGRGWNLIEVKSSTSVKEVYKPDVAIQYHVLNGAGIDVHRAGILHINNQYVFDGSQIDMKGLLVIALIALVEDEQAPFENRNSAIWALGQIGDRRALPVLEKLDTDEEQHPPYDSTAYIVQYSVEKALKQINGFTVTRWMYRWLD